MLIYIYMCELERMGKEVVFVLAYVNQYRFQVSPCLVAGVNSALESLHRLNVDSVGNVLKLNVASFFMLDVTRFSGFVHIDFDPKTEKEITPIYLDLAPDPILPSLVYWTTTCTTFGLGSDFLALVLCLNCSHISGSREGLIISLLLIRLALPLNRMT